MDASCDSRALGQIRCGRNSKTNSIIKFKTTHIRVYMAGREKGAQVESLNAS